MTGAGGDGGGAAVTVALLAAPGPHPAGAPIGLRVEVRNTGGAQLYLVGVLDGSETGTRYPHYLPSVAIGDRVVAAPPAPEDPLVGPLLAADVVRLRPGEAFDPTVGARRLPLSTFDNFSPEGPGTYRYTLVLDTACDEPGRWFGRFGQSGDPAELLDLLARVPRTRVVATLDVEVSS